MKRRVRADTVPGQLSQILDDVAERGDEIVIERAGHPVAVVIPLDRYRQIEAKRADLWRMIDELWEQNKEVDPMEVEREIDAAVREVRRAHRQAAEPGQRTAQS